MRIAIQKMLRERGSNCSSTCTKYDSGTGEGRSPAAAGGSAAIDTNRGDEDERRDGKANMLLPTLK
jgi:hypothetical protein